MGGASRAAAGTAAATADRRMDSRPGVGARARSGNAPTVDVPMAPITFGGVVDYPDPARFIGNGGIDDFPLRLGTP